MGGTKEYDFYYLPDLSSDAENLYIKNEEEDSVFGVRRVKVRDVIISNEKGKDIYKVKESLDSSIVIINLETKAILESVRVRGTSMASENFLFEKKFIFATDTQLMYKNSKRVGEEIVSMKKISLLRQYEDKALLIAFYYAAKCQQLLNTELASSGIQTHVGGLALGLVCCTIS